MIVDNFLLPRFLILELLCACHWFEHTKAVDVLTCEANKDTSAKKGIYELREIIDSDNKISTYKFSAVNNAGGAKALKNYLLEDDLMEDEGSGDVPRPQCRFSLRGQYWKFPPLLFHQDGTPILPVDETNNPDMEVVIEHDEEVMMILFVVQAILYSQIKYLV